MNMLARRIAIACFGLLLPLPALAGEVEVMHWWTSAGEQRAVGVLKAFVERKGHTWKDIVVAGGGGKASMSVLRVRTLRGEPPSAALLKGPDIQEWGRLGLLAALDDVATPGRWDRLLPPQVAETIKHDGRYVAVPVGIHRANWLWLNPAVFAKAGATPPATLDALFAAAERLKAAGFIPIAHGGQPWQDGILFENLALAILGPRDYHRAFVQLDREVLTGAGMAEAFAALKKLRAYVDDASARRDWTGATDLVIRGRAGMQIMGDWAKGEWRGAGKVAGRDYLCLPFPGTAGSFLYSIDSLATFRLDDAQDRHAQDDLARIAMEPAFQQAFNREKGSIPVRLDQDASGFDSCARRSMRDFRQAAAGDGLQPSLASMATSSYVQNAVFEMVGNFVNDPHADPRKAAHQLAAAIQAVR